MNVKFFIYISVLSHQNAFQYNCINRIFKDLLLAKTVHPMSDLMSENKIRIKIHTFLCFVVKVTI